MNAAKVGEERMSEKPQNEKRLHTRMRYRNQKVLAHMFENSKYGMEINTE